MKARTVRRRNKKTGERSIEFVRSLELRASDELKPCPFCGSSELELCNTHTASYWIACSEYRGGCGAEVHGKAYGLDRSSEGLTQRQHRAAADSAVKAWNRRTWVKS